MEVLILVALGGWLFAALRSIARHKGGCGGCSGNCASCHSRCAK